MRRKQINVELMVGWFVIIGLICFVYITVWLGGVQWFEDEHYVVNARFRSISGLKQGSVVEIAGVRVGKVERIILDPEAYEAVVQLSIKQDVKLQEDSIASIRTAGLIGDRFVNITPGGADEIIAPGAEITETESAISLEELISKYVFESSDK